MKNIKVEPRSGNKSRQYPFCFLKKLRNHIINIINQFASNDRARDLYYCKIVFVNNFPAFLFPFENLFLTSTIRYICSTLKVWCCYQRTEKFFLLILAPSNLSNVCYPLLLNPAEYDCLSIQLPTIAILIRVRILNCIALSMDRTGLYKDGRSRRC